MNKYSKLIKLRLAWWYVWWGFCVLSLVVYTSNLFDFLIHPQYQTSLSGGVIVFWFCAFAVVVSSMIPSTKRLLKKDLRKNTNNIYAKAMLLEISLKKRKKEAAKKKEDIDIEEHIKSMEDEMKG